MQPSTKTRVLRPRSLLTAAVLLTSCVLLSERLLSREPLQWRLGPGDERAWRVSTSPGHRDIALKVVTAADDGRLSLEVRILALCESANESVAFYRDAVVGLPYRVEVADGLMSIEVDAAKAADAGEFVKKLQEPTWTTGRSRPIDPVEFGRREIGRCLPELLGVALRGRELRVGETYRGKRSEIAFGEETHRSGSVVTTHQYGEIVRFGNPRAYEYRGLQAGKSTELLEFYESRPRRKRTGKWPNLTIVRSLGARGLQVTKPRLLLYSPLDGLVERMIAITTASDEASRTEVVARRIGVPRGTFRPHS